MDHIKAGDSDDNPPGSLYVKVIAFPPRGMSETHLA